MAERDAQFASAATLFSAYRPVERYRELVSRFYGDTFDPAVAITALDTYLMRQVLTYQRGGATVVDLAAGATLGASTIGWADHPSVRRVIAPQQGGGSRALDWRALVPRAAEELDIAAPAFVLPEANIADQDGWAAVRAAIPALSAVVFVLALPEQHAGELDARLAAIFEQYRDAIVLLLPLGLIGESATLRAALTFAEGHDTHRLIALREVAPFFAESRLGLIGRRDNALLREVGDRLRALYEGNFQFLALVEAVVSNARREEELLVSGHEETARMRTRLGELEGLIPLKDRHIANLEAMLEVGGDRPAAANTGGTVAKLSAQLAAAELERQRLADQLRTIQSRASWQLLERAWNAQMRVAPPDTPQGKVWLATARLARGGLRLGRSGGSGSGGRVRASSSGNAEDDRERRIVRVVPELAPPAAPAPNSGARQGDQYEKWRAAFEPGPAELASQRQRAAQLPYRPLISVVTPVFDPPPHILRETIASVVAQSYERWELCLVDGGSADPAVRAVLEECAAQDGRIRVRYLEDNLGIAGNANEAARLAEGEFLAFLDHDDLLAPQALFAVAEALGASPDADLVYCDEDKISEDSAARSEPFFKPDWSPELLVSANYLMHSVIRRETFLALEGFDPRLDGAQDWDLALRCAERAGAIVHVPQVLYHWRQMAGSTAAVFTAKPYVFENQLRSVTAHLQRRGIEDVTARFVQPGILRATWPTRGALVSIVIPTRDKVELVRACLLSLLRRTTYPNYEIILVDNGSTEAETLAFYADLARDPRVTIVDYAGPFNYSEANNLGARYAAGEFLLFLNNDIEIIESDWLDELVRWAEQPEIGAVGAKLLYPEGQIQHAGVVVGMEGHASHIFWGATEGYGGIFGSTDWYRDYLAVTGACLMLRRAIFEAIGGFDEEYTLAFSDIEICLRAHRAGYRNIYTPFARLRHHEGGSRGQYIPLDDMQLGYDHMHDQVERGDPYFNPNLSYASRLPALLAPGEEARIARLRRLCEVGEDAGSAPHALAADGA